MELLTITLEDCTPEQELTTSAHCFVSVLFRFCFGILLYLSHHTSATTTIQPPPLITTQFLSPFFLVCVCVCVRACVAFHGARCAHTSVTKNRAVLPSIIGA